MHPGWVSLAGWLRRRRRTELPEHDPAHAWRSTTGEFISAFVAAAGVRRTPPKPPAGPPIEQICADLRRINREIAKVLADPGLPARYHRLLAASWAYDAALADACRAVGVQPPPRVRLGQLERLETEAVLTAHGVQW